MHGGGVSAADLVATTLCIFDRLIFAGLLTPIRESLRLGSLRGDDADVSDIVAFLE